MEAASKAGAAEPKSAPPALTAESKAAAALGGLLGPGPPPREPAPPPDRSEDPQVRHSPPLPADSWPDVSRMSALSELTRCILPPAQTSREAELKKEIFERCSVVLLSLTNTEGCKPVFCAPQPRSLAAAPQIRRANICTSEPTLCRSLLSR